MNVNEIYLTKRFKIIPGTSVTSSGSMGMALTFQKNIEALGFVFHPTLLRYIATLDEKTISALYVEIVPVLKKMKGAHVKFAPMYPNFPQQVIDMEEGQLYFNALCHYYSAFLQDIGIISDTYLPYYDKDERPPLFEGTTPIVLGLGNLEDFNSIFSNLIASKGSLSQTDKEIVGEFVRNYKGEVISLLPNEIPFKENLCLLASLFYDLDIPLSPLSSYIKTATDVLRIATRLSGGDISLATNTKFKKFNRKTRRFLLETLNSCGNLEEDMVRYKGNWIRLGEILHPGEYQFLGNSYRAFNKLRNEKITTFNGKVESLIKSNNLNVLDALKTRPGEFARRLDHLLRINPKNCIRIVGDFMEVSDKVSTPVLLQAYHHFKTRNEVDSRTIFPKGDAAKLQLVEGLQPEIKGKGLVKSLVDHLESSIMLSLASKSPLGKVYVDKALKNYLVPFSQRSASKALRTIVRGSSIPLSTDYDTIRFFLWWKNGEGRTDIDLSAMLLDNSFNVVDTIAYYNLKGYGGHHSGDITNAPKGACEFIDISINKVLNLKKDGLNNGRYIIMSVYSYTNQPYCDLPECFAGWMMREKANSGEIFEPKIVENKVDLTSKARVAIPLVIDCMERKVIWCDLAFSSQRPIQNNGRNTHKTIGTYVKAIVNLQKPNLYDLFTINAKARGTLVDSRLKANLVFSPYEGVTPFDTDIILSQYL